MRGGKLLECLLLYDDGGEWDWLWAECSGQSNYFGSGCLVFLLFRGTSFSACLSIFSYFWQGQQLPMLIILTIYNKL